MELSAELSLYPLDGAVDANVMAFIHDLVVLDQVSVVTNTMSTQISGEWQAVMTTVDQALRQSAERAGRQVLVAKFLPQHRIEVGPGD